MWHLLSPLDGPKTSLSELLHPASGFSFSHSESHKRSNKWKRLWEEGKEYLEQSWRSIKCRPLSARNPQQQVLSSSPCLKVYFTHSIQSLSEVWGDLLITFCLPAKSNWLITVIYWSAEDKQQHGVLQGCSPKHLLVTEELWWWDKVNAVQCWHHQCCSAAEEGNIRREVVTGHQGSVNVIVQFSSGCRGLN